MHRQRGKRLVEEEKGFFYNDSVNKKLNILLVCGSGASSSFMAAKMRYAAKAKGLDLNLTARSEGEISNFIGDVDAIMVGPHLSGDYEKLKKTYEDVCKIILMKKEYYGNLYGEKAIEHLLEELKLK